MLLGDSRTDGGVNTWPAALAQEMRNADGRPWPLVNWGASGATVITTLAQLPGRISAAGFEPPAVQRVLINLGVNDAFDPLTPAQRIVWEDNYKAIIDTLTAAYPLAQVYIARPWKRGFTAGKADGIAVAIDNIVADRPGVAYLGHDERVWLEGGDNGATNTYDGEHYSAAGNVAILPVWMSALGY